MTQLSCSLHNRNMLTHSMNQIGSREAARRLGISIPTLSRWVRSGRIKATKPLDYPTAPLIFEEAEVERIRRARAELSGGAS